MFSADTFVKEFNPAETDIRRILFLRGSIAGVTIKEELPFEVDEWTVYSTERANDSIDSLVDLLQQQQHLNVLFASPSAVEVFAEEVAPRDRLERLYNRGYRTCDGKSVARSWRGRSC